VDIPLHRGTDWADRPVDGADLDAALGDSGLVFEPGDAVCLDMGRDRFESASGHMLGGPETEQDAGGGLSADGARWVAEHRVSILAWDMLDSRDAKAAHASAHVLTWATGLLLLDNCDFAALRRAHEKGATSDALLRRRLTESFIGLNVMRWDTLRMVTGLMRGNPGAETSLLKLSWPRWHQELGEIEMDVLGAASQVVGEDYELDPLQRTYLLSRAETIYGGAQQIHLNIVAERLLGLPAEPGVPAGDHHPGALGQEPAGHGQAQAGRAAGDQRALSLQQAHGRPV